MSNLPEMKQILSSIFPEMKQIPAPNGIRVENWNPGFFPEGGLTKREYFAALALQAYLTSPLDIGNVGMANLAVQAADALIAELSK